MTSEAERDVKSGMLLGFIFGLWLGALIVGTIMELQK